MENIVTLNERLIHIYIRYPVFIVCYKKWLIWNYWFKTVLQHTLCCFFIINAIPNYSIHSLLKSYLKSHIRRKIELLGSRNIYNPWPLFVVNFLIQGEVHINFIRDVNIFSENACIISRTIWNTCNRSDIVTSKLPRWHQVPERQRGFEYVG